MNDGKLTVVVGASRSGKTRWIREQLKAEKKLIIWDIKGEYFLHWRTKKPLPGWTVTRTRTELIAAVKAAAGKSAFKIAHSTDDLSQFDYFCRAAYTLGRLSPLTIIAEELADVTTPAKAPPGWGMICRKILGYGCNVFAVTQRPAESDKTSFGNNSMIHCHRMARAKDRKYMAEEMDLSLDEILSLKPLQWIEKDSDGKINRGNF